MKQGTSFSTHSRSNSTPTVPLPTPRTGAVSDPLVSVGAASAPAAPVAPPKPKRMSLPPGGGAALASEQATKRNSIANPMFEAGGSEEDGARKPWQAAMEQEASAASEHSLAPGGGALALLCSAQARRVCLSLGAGLLVLGIILAAVYLSGGVSEKRPTCLPPAAATAAASPLLQVPIRVHVLQSAAHSDLNAAVTEQGVRRWILDAARIFKPVGLVPSVESVAFEQARNGAEYAQERDTIAQGGRRRRRGLADLRPLPQGDTAPDVSNAEADALLEARANQGGWDMYVMNDFTLCGLALTGSARSRGSFFVKAQPCDGNVKLDAGSFTGAPISTQAVTVAHELGHCLSLAHEADNCELMARFIRGLQIDSREQVAARTIATSGVGFVKGE